MHLPAKATTSPSLISTTAMLNNTLAHPDIVRRKVVPIALDLRSQASIAAAFERALAALGQLDLLVNNAGRALVRP